MKGVRLCSSVSTSDRNVFEPSGFRCYNGASRKVSRLADWIGSAKVSIRKRYAVLVLLAAAILAVLSVWLREGNGPGASQRLYQGKTLQAWFNQLQGSQGDAVVAT